MKGTLYVITNKINGKKYIGKTYKTIEERFEEHKRDSRKPKNYNRKLYKDFCIFGDHNFKIEEIGMFEDGILEEKEIEYISKYDTYENGYNQTLGGDGKRCIKYTDEELIGLYHSLGTIKKVSEHTGHDAGWISNIIKRNGVNVVFAGRKPIKIVQNGMVFDNPTECAKWLIDNDIVLTKNIGYVTSSIRRVLSGLRKQYVGFTFEIL